MLRSRRVTALLAPVAAFVVACTGAAPSGPAGAGESRPSVPRIPPPPPEGLEGIDLPVGPTYEINLDEPGGVPDPAVWDEVYSGPGTYGGEMRPENFTTENGVLTIVGHGEGLGGGCLCGDAAPKEQYGIYQASFRTSVGQGYIAAVLIWPDDDGDKDAAQLQREYGEFDLVEVDGLQEGQGDRQSAATSLHYFDPWGSDNEQLIQTHTKEDFTRWQRLRITYLPDLLTAHINGREVFRETDPNKIPQRAMHFTVQLEWHFTESLQPSDESRAQGTDMQLSDIRFTPVLGVSLNPDGTLYEPGPGELPGQVLTIG